MIVSRRQVRKLGRVVENLSSEPQYFSTSDDSSMGPRVSLIEDNAVSIGDAGHFATNADLSLSN